jgi:hypothetical protein
MTDVCQISNIIPCLFGTGFSGLLSRSESLATASCIAAAPRESYRIVTKDNSSESLRNDIEELKEEAAARIDRAKKTSRQAADLSERIKFLERPWERKLKHPPRNPSYKIPPENLRSKTDPEVCQQPGFDSPSVRKLKANAKRFCGRKWSLREAQGI